MMVCPATFATRMAIRYEPPPKMKRRPCRGSASDFDPASLEMVSLNGWIIRRREGTYKATQVLYEAHAIPSIVPVAAMRRALSGVSRSQP